MTRRELRELNHRGGENNSGASGRRRERKNRAAVTAPILPQGVKRGLIGAGVVAALTFGVSVAWDPLFRGDDSVPAGLFFAGDDAGIDADEVQWDQAVLASDAAQTTSRDYAREILLEGNGVQFSVAVDGETVDINSAAPTLAQALIREGIVVGWDDVVSAPMNEQAEEGAEISIARSESSIITTTEEVKFETVRKETSSLLRGTEKVETKGENGVRTITYRATEIDGEEVARELITEVLDQDPVDEVILVGTRAPVVVASGGSGSGSGSGGSGSGGSGSSEPVIMSYSGESPKAIAQQKISARGWGQDQWVCLERLWHRESGWNYRAANPRSTARGIPQAMMSVHFGGNWRSPSNTRAQNYLNNPAVQIDWGLNYIIGRYGTPCGAWAKSQSSGWY